MVDSNKKRGEKLSLADVVKCVSKTQAAKMLDGFDGKKLAKIFDDEDLMMSCDCLFENCLNVSQTAKILYMHRNTLIYRLDKIKRVTGLDVRKFSDAVTFSILHLLYDQR